ncbi:MULTISPECIES: TrkA family potassium uptake protein [Neobacillus]|jgi:trk system potassium uptake protein|uniref:TrkA family potassium uptake protein n=1 Tax=Neobacillus sedimentimangrovi TaxID=2699460 RepID=A0ABS8QLC3_9BACI|nr:TrkA family potassium uptake protein [Neobacillus sedimentimangrovi]AIM15283.1 potassium uptake system protein [Bacillus sp. X1(2014)]MCD4839892.1 TrkA family potassium uptake protein [Neobacillus sedimentimangrovi]
MVKQYAVIGLGRFGSSVAARLYESGQEVLGVDVNIERVEESNEFVTHAVIADSTDPESLKAIGIRNFDTVIVAIGNDIQASILSVLLLKELGVKKVIAKALNNLHGQVLEKVGADWVIFPERDMGIRVAHQLLSPNVLNFIEISKNYSVEEVRATEKMKDKTLRELDIRAKYNLSVIAIRNDNELTISPSPDKIIDEGDVLVVIGENRDLERFANLS